MSERFLNHRKRNFMVWKKGNTTTVNLLLSIRKELTGAREARGSSSTNDRGLGGFSRRGNNFSIPSPRRDGEKGD